MARHQVLAKQIHWYRIDCPFCQASLWFYADEHILGTNGDRIWVRPFRGWAPSYKSRIFKISWTWSKSPSPPIAHSAASNRCNLKRIALWVWGLCLLWPVSCRTQGKALKPSAWMPSLLEKWMVEKLSEDLLAQQQPGLSQQHRLMTWARTLGTLSSRCGEWPRNTSTRNWSRKTILSCPHQDFVYI